MLFSVPDARIGLLWSDLHGQKVRPQAVSQSGHGVRCHLHSQLSCLRCFRIFRPFPLAGTLIRFQLPAGKCPELIRRAGYFPDLAGMHDPYLCPQRGISEISGAAFSQRTPPQPPDSQQPVAVRELKLDDLGISALLKRTFPDFCRQTAEKTWSYCLRRFRHGRQLELQHCRTHC